MFSILDFLQSDFLSCSSGLASRPFLTWFLCNGWATMTVTGSVERSAFSLDLDALRIRVRLAAGDEQARAAFMLGVAWLCECKSGTLRSWTDIAFLCGKWDRHIVLKGIQAVQDAHVDGINVSNYGTYLVCGGAPFPSLRLVD